MPPMSLFRLCLCREHNGTQRRASTTNMPQPHLSTFVCTTQKAEKIFWSDTRGDFKCRRLCEQYLLRPLCTVRIWVEGKCEDAPPEIRSDILRLGQIFLCPRKIPTIQGNARDILLCLRVFSPSCRNLARKIFASLPEGFI